MDLLVIALKALAAQQALQSTRRTARGGLVAAALVPVAIGVFLIGVAFLGYACYAALLDSVSPSSAALITSGALFLTTLCIFLAIWLSIERAKNAKEDLDLDDTFDKVGDTLERVADRVTDEVKENPAGSLALAALAGAFIYFTFMDKK
jgi:formate/nitrite transporter FocA (FNT family)